MYATPCLLPVNLPCLENIHVVMYIMWLPCETWSHMTEALIIIIMALKYSFFLDILRNYYCLCIYSVVVSNSNPFLL